jgi:transcription termination/antitermination protein NusG
MWYVIKVVTGKEKKMKETIENEFKHNGLDKFVSRLLIPSQKVVQIRNGKKYNIDKNFFPGYILVECENIKDIEGGLKHINGVSSILSDALKQSEVDRILGKENEVQDTSNNFYLNQQVKIIDGPFASFIGTIQELNEEKKKVKIAVLIFGRETMLDLTLQQIERE